MIELDKYLEKEKIRNGAIRNFLKDVSQPYEGVKPLQKDTIFRASMSFIQWGRLYMAI